MGVGGRRFTVRGAAVALLSIRNGIGDGVGRVADHLQGPLLLPLVGGAKSGVMMVGSGGRSGIARGSVKTKRKAIRGIVGNGSRRSKQQQQQRLKLRHWRRRRRNGKKGCANENEIRNASGR